MDGSAIPSSMRNDGGADGRADGRASSSQLHPSTFELSLRGLYYLMRSILVVTLTYCLAGAVWTTTTPNGLDRLRALAQIDLDRLQRRSSYPLPFGRAEIPWVGAFRPDKRIIIQSKW